MRASPQGHEPLNAQHRLIFSCRARVVESWLVLLLAVVLTTFAGWVTTVIALSAALVIAFLTDLLVRRIGTASLGQNPSNSAPLPIRRAVKDACGPLGIDPTTIYPRSIKNARGKMRTAFTAGALHTRKGILLFLGEDVIERTRDATNLSKTDGERIFAYDEIRAVIGHEIAHIMPGTGVSSRLLSIPYRMTEWLIPIAFWVQIAFLHTAYGIVGALANLLANKLATKMPQDGRGIHMAVIILLCVVTFASHAGIALLLVAIVWPHLRPLPSQALQRRIEDGCDQVAITCGADPGALARFLQRFEPPHSRAQPLWSRLHATHPPIHKRIVKLDHQPAPSQRHPRR